ncbi:short-chain fatty acyl-CoA regulator family protein [Jannaschia sp. S6380]|uniref:short-chain fatty acyl-CoA regulator family protein n=1 Tax=Jannaschia sp. S6380 TaxID=2926408 RepID=UPI001FF3CB9D|nr:short-chain fatty acyl-CoA regulator family protein [Jannaschia sp. S6380]MCK0167471.1 short-chain fatty acyl-CoA regulator family protein [Jannaschia sp. S6380]
MARAAPTGSRIRERRLSLGMRQIALAAEVGISASYLNLIEHNRRPIGGTLLLRLARALDIDRAALAEDGDDALVSALEATGASGRLPVEAAAQAPELARRYPAWARLIAAQAETLAGQARKIDAMSDRLTHDPALAAAMHELLSTVSTVRSTASILAQTPEIDANWLGRFHANLDQDSRRLAEGAAAVLSLFDRQEGRAAENLLPIEEASRFLDAHGHRFDAIEADGAAAIPALVAPIEGAAARKIATGILEADAADALRLPSAIVDATSDPATLVEVAEGDLALILRRIGLRDPARGLLICDASGAMLRRKSVAGFALPVMGAGCPLWPIYAALSQPGRARVTALETPDGAGWRAHTVAEPAGPDAFDREPVLHATMLLTRDDAAEGRVPVGPGCRTCPRAACTARREPSVVTGDG